MNDTDQAAAAGGGAAFDGIPPPCPNSSLVKRQAAFHYPRLYFNWFVVAFGYAAVLVLVPVFMVYHRKLERMRVRRLQPVLTTALAIVVYVSNPPLAFAVPGGFANVPCLSQLILDIFTVPLVASPIITQLYLLFFLTSFSRVARSERPDLERIDVDFKDSAWQTALAALSSLTMVFRSDRDTRLQRGDKLRNLRALRFFISSWGLPTFFLLLTLPLVAMSGIVISTDPAFVNGCSGCNVGDVERAFLFLEIFVLIVWGVWLAWVVRKYPDPWGLARECTLMIACAVFAAVGWILYISVPSVTSKPDLAFDFTFMVTLGYVGMLVVQTMLQVVLGLQTTQWRSWMKMSKWMSGGGDGVVGVARRPHQPDHGGGAMSGSQLGSQGIVTNASAHDLMITTEAIVARETASEGGPRLRAVLANAEMKTLLEDLLMRECGLETLYALQSIADFRMTYFDMAPTTRDARARKFVRLYIASDALFVVNVAHAMAERITKTVERGNVSADVFDELRQELTVLLEYGAVARLHEAIASGQLVVPVVPSSPSARGLGVAVGSAAGAGAATLEAMYHHSSSRSLQPPSSPHPPGSLS